MTLAFIVIFVILWVSQMLMMYWQAQRFMRSVAELRALGDTATGRHKKTGLRTYVSIAVCDGRVVGSRVLRGFTVFAAPRSEPLLLGARIADVIDESIPGLSPRTAKAAAHAATLYRQQRRRPARVPVPTPTA